MTAVKACPIPEAEHPAGTIYDRQPPRASHVCRKERLLMSEEPEILAIDKNCTVIASVAKRPSGCSCGSGALRYARDDERVGYTSSPPEKSP